MELVAFIPTCGDLSGAADRMTPPNISLREPALRLP